MLTKERRPFTEAERERVRTLLAATYQRQGRLSRAAEALWGQAGGSLLGVLLVFLPLTAWNWLAGLLHKWALPHTAHVILLYVGAGVGMAMAAWMTYQMNRATTARLQEERRKRQQDLEGDEAEIWHCEVSRVVQLEEDEDEDPGFFMELSPGQTLFLQSQYLYDFVEDESGMDDDAAGQTRPQDHNTWPPAPRTGSAYARQFPCRRFDLIYAPSSRVQLDLVCLGGRFEEWPTHCPGLESTWEAKCFPEDGDVLPISLDTLDADLNRWAAQQEPPKD